MKLLTLITLSLFIISCGSEHESSHTKDFRSISLIQGEPIKLTREIQGMNSNGVEIVIPKEHLNAKSDLLLSKFYVTNTSADLVFYSDKYKSHFLPKHNIEFKTASWIEPKDAISFDIHKRLNFSFDRPYQGYPHLKESFLFIEMEDYHNEYRLKMMVDLHCPQGAQYLRGYPSTCINNNYKVQIKIFDIVKL